MLGHARSNREAAIAPIAPPPGPGERSEGPVASRGASAVVGPVRAASRQWGIELSAAPQLALHHLHVEGHESASQGLAPSERSAFAHTIPFRYGK